MTLSFRPNPFLQLSEPRYRTFTLTLLDTLLQADLEEAGDLTTSSLGIFGSGTATIKAKSAGVLAGLEEVTLWLQGKGITCSPHLADGAKLTPGERILDLEGNFPTLLQTERTALNALQRLSGIATLTDELTTNLGAAVRAGLAPAEFDPKRAAKGSPAPNQFEIYNLQSAIPSPLPPMNHEPCLAGRQASAMNSILPPLLAATRKTPWGYLDKRAVQLGGGWAHRLGLWEAVLIKDNHLAALRAEGASNPILTSLERVLSHANHGAFVEVEVRSRAEMDSFVAATESLTDKLAGIPLLLMLDNFHPRELSTIVPEVRQRLAHGEVKIELSGGITAENLTSFAGFGADVLSLGSLTHSSTALDLSLELHHH